MRQGEEIADLREALTLVWAVACSVVKPTAAAVAIIGCLGWAANIDQEAPSAPSGPCDTVKAGSSYSPSLHIG